MSLPQPMTDPACDLRGLPFMPLDVVRLMDSDFFALSTGDEFKAGISLWCKSWNQVPAGSLPDNDRVLAHLSMAGKDWPEVKEMAMRGWVLCSDGRWYHPVVSEKAVTAWGKRLAQRERAEKRWKSKEKPENKEEEPSHGNATASENECHGITTAPENASHGICHGICHGNARERERERESVRDNISSSLRSEDSRHDDVQVKPETPKAKKGTRLPDDWAPSAALQEFARAKGLDPASVTERFVDYWRGVPGQKGVKLDWDATWRNWVRTDSAKYAPRPSPPRVDRPRTAAQNADENAKLLLERMGIRQ